MEIHEMLILAIANFGIVLIPVGYDLIQADKARYKRYAFEGTICIVYGSICLIGSIAGYMNLLFTI